MSDLQCPARLVIARHAEAAYRRPGAPADDGGWLTQTGLGQARALGERLRHERVAAVYTSPMARAVQTGALAAAALGLPGSVAIDGLQECSVGDLAGGPHDDPRLPEVVERWVRGDLDVPVPGGATGRAVLDRVRWAVEHIADRHRGETVLVVSHGEVLTLALSRLPVNGRPDQALARPLPHGAFLRVDIDADGWRLIDPWPGQTGGSAHRTNPDADGAGG